MEHTNEIESQRIIRLADHYGELVTECDGFVYFWPSASATGCLSSFHLRTLADEIDRRNAGIEKSISDYFEGRES